MKHYKYIDFALFIFLLSGCAVSVPEYRIAGQDTFVLSCYRGQTVLGHARFSIYIDPIHKVAFRELDTQYELKERKRLVNVYESLEITSDRISFVSQEAEASIFLNRSKSELINNRGKVFAKNCRSYDSISGNLYVLNQIEVVKSKWSKIDKNLYRER